MPGFIKGPARVGPFKGAGQSRGFAGQVSIVVRNLVVTQSGLELWFQEVPQLRATQVGLEPWFKEDPQLKVTQIGLEVWISIAPAPVPIPPRAKLGPRGFLGIPPRRFRERADFTIIEPPPPEPNVPIVLPGNHMGPNGLLGIPIRRFKERSGSVSFILNPYVPTTSAPAFFWVIT